MTPFVLLALYLSSDPTFDVAPVRVEGVEAAGSQVGLGAPAPFTADDARASPLVERRAPSADAFPGGRPRARPR